MGPARSRGGFKILGPLDRVDKVVGNFAGDMELAFSAFQTLEVLKIVGRQKSADHSAVAGNLDRFAMGFVLTKSRRKVVRQP